LTNVTVLYAPITDLRIVMDGTDAGSGAPSALTDAQLTLALTSASNIVSAYIGNVWDNSQSPTPGDFTPPVLLHDIALDLASWYAWRIYNKHKEIGPQHPASLAYTHAMKVLEDVRNGLVRLDPDIPGSPGFETGHINNPLPPIFTGDDSNTEIDPATGGIVASTPPDMYRPGWSDLTGDFGPEYEA
jgi:Protein of unknown function (DUF1320)